MRSGRSALSSSGATVISELPSHESLRLLARSLSAYLCGTHSGLLASRRRDRLDVDELARNHRELRVSKGETTAVLGETSWAPEGDAESLASALRQSLDRPEVVDLIVFGSQARGSTTGFSDVDAILVVDDGVAEDPRSLRSLRPAVLAAQRAVLAYQPMQHHAFEVLSLRLLSRANESLQMPAAALSETRSLFGHTIEASFGPDRHEDAVARLQELVSNTAQVSAWPRHPWLLHGAVSMFELLPALYLQSRGQPVPKWRSFAAAREEFGDAWSPYDVLEQVRQVWPRRPRPLVRAASSALRNPWLCVAGWRRLPAAPIEPAWSLLTSECLEALRRLTDEMKERAR